MRQILTLFYSTWCKFWLLVLFVVLFPFMYLFLQREPWHRYAHKVNYVWGRLFFWVIGMPIQVDYRFRPDPKQAYVFCSNHFSFLDIAVMGVIIRNYYAFVGKSDVKHVPLFGYMFSKLHIQVDRSRPNSRAYSLTKSLKTLAQGRSVVIFPEGGMVSTKPPKMHYPFKSGAFTMAIHQQVPVVPVTLLNNYQILPDQKKLRMHWQPLRAIVHPPIETQGMTPADVDHLKEQTFRVIDKALMTQIDSDYQATRFDTTKNYG